MNFAQIFLQVLSLFLIILIGYTLRKRKIVNTTFKKDLSELIYYVTLPSLVLVNIQGNANISDSFNLITIILLSLLAYLIAFIFAFIYPKIFKTNSKSVGVYQFLLTFANVGFMGYPIVDVLFGSEMVIYAIMFVMPFNILVFTLGVYYMSIGNSDIKINLKTVFNPGLIAIITGFFLNSVNITIPSAFVDTLRLLGGLTTPLSMMMIGMSLAGTNLLSAFKNANLYFIILFRLLIFPIIIYLVYSRFNINVDILKVGVILAAMPGAAMTVILAEKYNCNTELASKGVVLSTLLSMFTIPLIALFLLSLS